MVVTSFHLRFAEAADLNDAGPHMKAQRPACATYTNLHSKASLAGLNETGETNELVGHPFEPGSALQDRKILLF
jgi:hypothetical protein